jgi:protein-tyrosine phosphatase
MGLDYSQGSVNFRDVGEWINCIAGRQLMPVGRLLRGGKLDFVGSPAEIGNPATIFNLRKGPDNDIDRFGASCFHFPISNDYEKYATGDPQVRRWLNSIVGCLQNDVQRFPLFIHCTSGKDRTGVVVAALLLIAGIDRPLIEEEYLLSDGDVKREWIQAALDGMGAPEEYFNRCELGVIRAKIREGSP